MNLKMKPKLRELLIAGACACVGYAGAQKKYDLSHYHWHQIVFDRINEDRTMVTYGDGYGHVIVCQEGFKGGDHAVSISSACTQVITYGGPYELGGK